MNFGTGETKTICVINKIEKLFKYDYENILQGKQLIIY